MGLFDHFPYTNVHELNLDWILSMMKALEAEWEAFTAGNSLTFADPMLHDISKTYAKNTIVLDGNGNAYVSLQAVPVGVGLQNRDYWLMVFDYEAFIEKVNKNFTARYYRGSYRATAAIAIGDWLTVDDVLCKATAAIAADDVLEVGVNIEHFTLEDFIKAFMQSANQLIQQYKNDIDASELLYRQQLAQDIADTTASLQAQLDAAISGATADSEVINARIGWNGINYSTLGEANRSQFMNLYTTLLKELIEVDYDSDWVVNSISPTSGANAAATNRLRLSYKSTAPLIRISTDNNHKISVYAYTGQSISTYVGCWNGSGLDTTANWFKEVYIPNIGQNYIRVLLANNDDSDMSLDDVQYVKIERLTDTSLTLANMIPDSKVVGDALDNLSASLSLNIQKNTILLDGSENLDALRTAGNYYINTAAAASSLFNNSSLPEKAAGRFSVMYTSNSSWVSQVFIPNGSGKKSFYIRKWDNINNVWLDWDVFDQYPFDFMQTNSYSFNPELRDVAETTAADITYSITDNIITASGTASSNAHINIYGATNKIPDWLVVGQKYYVELNKSNLTDDLQISVNAYDSDGLFIKAFFQSNEDGSFIIDSLTGVNGIIVRYRVPRGGTADGTASVKFLSAPSNKKLAETSTAPVHIRIMQNNIGKFNMGSSLSGTYHRFNTDNEDELLNNYRKVFTQYQPDFISIEEYEDFVDVYVPDTQTIDHRVDLDDELYDRLYPNIAADSTSYTSRLALLSKYEIIDSKRVSVPFTYEYEEIEHSASGSIRLTHVNIENKIIAIVTTALVPTSGDPEGIPMRAAMLQEIINMLVEDKYAFIALDANNGGDNTGGDTSTAPSIAEGNDIYTDVLLPNGYQSAQGSYLPWEMTYYSPRSYKKNCIDNIYYKDNGHVVFNGTEVLSSWYNLDDNLLASDHIPVIGDFTLL